LTERSKLVCLRFILAAFSNSYLHLIGIPSAPSRASILRVLLSCTPNSLTDADLTTLASKTHGYVGADLAALVREAGTRAIKRVISSYTTHHLTGADDPISPITLDDLLASLPLVPPSALRSLTLPVPPTSWSSLGGSSIALIRRKLTECISWPLLHPGSFERLGVSPPRGVLMYGPPGCSKTMVGRALASEGGVNFLGVRGPEVL
jgi:AAA family ATPase